MRRTDMSSSEVIKLIRDRLRFTQTELGNKMGVSKQSVYKWERGIVMPSHDYIRELMTIAKANKIKVKLEDFYSEH
jgi:transcriptional regulator with XRE-family HTH domain